MSINLIKRNSSSPFHLQRSMVDQGGEGGDYESGGYTGNSQYQSTGIGEATATIGKVAATAISSRTDEQKNADNVKKETRLENRSKKTELKKKQAETAGDKVKVARMEDRNNRVETRKATTTAAIKKYNDSEKPTLKSDIVSTKKEVKPVVESTATAKVNEDRQSSTATSAVGTTNIVDPNKTPGKNAWSDLASKFKIDQ